MWRALGGELERWAEAGATATLWWRDDDAVTDTPALRRLLRVTQDGGVRPGLAVIPASADVALVESLDLAAVDVLQHGYRHSNHAPPDQKKAEFGPHRPAAVMDEELRDGAARLQALFAGSGSRALAVLVPPWNRIDPALVSRLTTLGYRGLSAFAARARARDASGLRHLNTHVDPIAWHAGRCFAGERPVLAQLLDHLAARREGRVDVGEPTGLLTHHLVHDPRCWAFCERLLGVTAAHRAVRWLSGAEVFAGPEGTSGR